MSLLKRITVLFIVTYLMFKSSFMLLFFAHQYTFAQAVDLVRVFYYDDMFRIVGASVYGSLLVFNFIIYKIFSVNVRRDKIIAFDNPSGRVTVSLITLEDLVKRLVGQMDEVRESKTKITASKKGLLIKIRITLLSDINIPGLSSRIQALITKKIQDIVGIEEKIDVAIDVGKILPQEYRGPSKEAEESKIENTPEPKAPPYHGYRT